MHKIILIVVLFFSSFKLFSQGNSLYSQIGIGNSNPSTFQSNFSMGGLSATTSSKYFINPNNPASYSKLKFTTGEFGVFNSNNFYSNGDSSANSTALTLGNFGFAFPLAPNAGFAVGFTPYSRMKYSYSSNEVIFGDQDAVRKFDGEGNVSNVFIGSGIAFNNFSIGINAHYLFGELTKNEHLQFASSEFLNIRNQTVTLVRGFTADFGMQYSLPVNEEHSLVIGADYGIGNTIGANYYQKVSNYIIQQGTLNDAVVDVERHDIATYLENNETTPTNGSLRLPQSFKGGVAFSKKGRYLLGLDYQNNAWDAFKFNVDPNSLKRAQKLILGGEITPNEQAKGFENYFKSLIYRGGVNIGTSPIFVNGEQLQEFGLNFGMGFPLKKMKYESEKFGSYLFVSLGYDRLGGKKANTISEDYFKINLSVILNDKWFVKRKFD